jgi:hypothetical protein
MGKKKRAAAAEELDLVPIMNLVTILIPFLLMAAQFVSYAVIDSTLPAIGPPKEVEDKEDEEEPLNLSVFITDKGFSVKGSAGTLKNDSEEGEDQGLTIPCHLDGCLYDRDGEEGAAAAYNIEKLREVLTQVKEEYPDEQNVILVPEPGIPYEVLVLTMDGTRENPDEAANPDDEMKGQCKGRCLFPFVVIAGGVGVDAAQ